ncbi:MAG: hypothetical protein AAF958_04590 [Planctomycetota bacterium]
MPKTAEFCDIQVLYPDNWLPGPRQPEDGEGFDWELPSGGFVSIDHHDDAWSADEWIETTNKLLAEEYGELETEELPAETLPEGTVRAVEQRFYYLDLLILSRQWWIRRGTKQWAVHVQAESRRFDENQMVFEAILKQIP